MCTQASNGTKLLANRFATDYTKVSFHIFIIINLIILIYQEAYIHFKY